MTEMVQNLRQFDTERSLSNKEKLSRVQQNTENQIQYGVVRYSGPGAFNFELILTMSNLCPRIRR